MDEMRCHCGIQNVTKVDFNIEFQNDSCTMSNFGQKNKFCALFLESHWFRFKMCHQCQNQGQTGLEATGGPRGASQPLQSIKIYKNQT